MAAAVETEDNAALMDSLILCKFLRGVFADSRAEWAELLSAVTGFDYSAEELGRIAAQIIDEKKRYNLDQGWTPDTDTLPERFLSETLATGGGATASLPRERLRGMVAEYYRLRGWDAAGRPREPMQAGRAEG